MYHYFVESIKRFKSSCPKNVVFLGSYDSSFEATSGSRNANYSFGHALKHSGDVGDALMKSGARISIESAPCSESSRTFYHMVLIFRDAESRLAFELSVDSEKFYRNYRRYGYGYGV